MHATVAYLTDKQMKLIFDYIELADAYKNLPADVKIKFELYKAVSAREYSKTLNLVYYLLPQKEITPSPENDYYLMLAMMSHIALNENKKAKLLWQNYKNKENPPIELRLLSSYVMK